MVVSLVEHKEVELVAALDAIHGLLAARFDRLLATAGVSYAQLRVLECLAEEPDRDCTIGELARRLSVNQPAASKMAQRLAARGLVELRRHVADRRLRQVRPTDAGREAITCGRALLRADIRKYFSGWRDPELDGCHRLVRRLWLWLDGNRGVATPMPEAADDVTPVLVPTAPALEPAHPKPAPRARFRIFTRFER
jgi:DNA-binding MarR family transcriptional regulator